MVTSDRYPLRGVVVSLNTPFDEKDRIDFPSVERTVESHLLEGAVGYLTPAQAGEVTELSLPERIELVRFVRKLTSGRAHVIDGATADSEGESFALAEAAIDAGCNCVLAEVPPVRRGDAAGIIEFFRSLAAVGIETLMIQDLQWDGPGLDVSLIATMFETIPAFRCLKVEVAPAGPKYSAVLETTGGRLHVSGGWASDQMIEALDRGVDAFFSTAMTGLYRRIFEAYSLGIGILRDSGSTGSCRCLRSPASTWKSRFTSTSSSSITAVSSAPGTPASTRSRTIVTMRPTDNP